jgi:organic radical activating enzyme
MKSNNLTISIPTPKCKENCPYCVSKMTGRIQSNPVRFKANMPKVLQMAKSAGVTSVLVTGKGEPIDSHTDLFEIREFFKDFPLEIQVNADRYMTAHPLTIEKLNIFDVVAISADQLDEDFEKRTTGLLRLTLIIHDHTRVTSFGSIINYCIEKGIDQLSLRNPTIPLRYENSLQAAQTVEWIYKNTQKQNYHKAISQFESTNKIKLRKLNFGATVYDVSGISFTHFDYCVQDQNNGDDIRSLIYMEDGHLYTSWSFPSSKIF